MILALLLAAATPPPAPAGQLVPPPFGAGAAADPAQAVALFRDLCVAHWRDPEALHYAISTAPVIFAVVPKRDPSHPGETWRSPGLYLSYLPPDAGGTMATPQCTMHGTMKHGADQLTFAARVAEALKLRGGTTHTGAGEAADRVAVARSRRSDEGAGDDPQRERRRNGAAAGDPACRAIAVSLC